MGVMQERMYEQTGPLGRACPCRSDARYRTLTGPRDRPQSRWLHRGRQVSQDERVFHAGGEPGAEPRVLPARGYPKLVLRRHEVGPALLVRDPAPAGQEAAATQVRVPPPAPR